MTEGAALLALLQHGDSFFPGGGFAFSWGLETLAADGRVRTAADVGRFVAGQIAGRWSTLDRPAMVSAHRAAGDLDAAADIDRIVEAMAWPAELRDGSKRSGRAVLGVHARLGTPGTGAYRDRVRNDPALGHAAVVQGVAWHGVGLDEHAASAASAHGLCTGLLGAALRLGLIGHHEAQRLLTDLRPVVADALAQPIAPTFRLHAFTPAADIAMMRHERQGTRLFAN